MKLILIAAALLGGAFVGSASAQTRSDDQTVLACVEMKSPEGIPASGPLREKILREMQGGPQACIGVIRNTCRRVGQPADECNRREATAWLRALRINPEDRKAYGAKNIGVFDAGVKRIEANATALCRSAASVSAWGREMIKTGSSAVRFDRSHPCVMELIAQQTLAVLVHRRGA